jgi:hypothetical protein
MTGQKEFADLGQAMAYCQSSNHQVVVLIAGTQWRLFPSGSSLALSEKLFHELDASQQEHVIAAFTGQNLHRFAYHVETDDAVITRRSLDVNK